SWTLLADKKSSTYQWTWFVGGVGGAHLFLFLAGVALVLPSAGRVRNGRSEREAAALARRRGWQVFGLAFLFRLQSWLISGGAATGLLKVDVLNIMGIGMLLAALLWSIGRNNTQRALLFAGATAAATMLTPIVRTAGAVAVLPDPVEWYVRPRGGGAAFALFPWFGFLF